VVYLWNVKTGARRVIKLPRSASYLAAAPTGVVFSTAHGAVKIRGVAGHVSTLGSPFGTTSRVLSWGAAGPDGVVVSDFNGHAAYLPVQPPHAAVKLDLPTTEPLECSSVSATYAACSQVSNDDAAWVPDSAFLVPIDGSAPTQAVGVDGCEPGSGSLAGASLVFRCVAGEDVSIYRQAAGSSIASKVSATAGFDAVTAYDASISRDSMSASLRAVAATGPQVALLPARRSPVTVDTFAIDGSRVVYADDQPIASHPDRKESVFTRRLTTGGRRIKASSPRQLSSVKGRVTGNLVGASRRLAVYATAAGVHDHIDVATLRIVTSAGRHIAVRNVIEQGMIQVSGDEVLFQRESPPTGSTVEVFDAGTGRTRIVRRIHGGLNYVSIALWKHYISYATKHGAIYRENFITGKRTQLANALANDPGGVEIAVYEYGSWVGWSAQPVEDELKAPLNKLRNVTTMAPAISLPHRLYSLTSSGALLDDTSTFRETFSQQGRITKATPFWLRSYRGRTTKLFGARSYVAGPEISAGRVAWAARDGVLRIARLPIS
jgi:hypothetical protein